MDGASVLPSQVGLPTPPPPPHVFPGLCSVTLALCGSSVQTAPCPLDASPYKSLQAASSGATLLASSDF